MSENDMDFRDADVIVIGGGAAGTFAACRLSEAGKKVMIVEPNCKLGRKLRITGKGRCNLTNNSSSENVMKHIMRNQKFMFSALAGFSPDDVMSWFESKGVPLKTERGNRVFPKSDRADDVADALADELKRRRVSVVRDKALHIIVSDGAACGVECEKAKYYAGSVLLATGGMSYPATGSTGDGYRMAREVGHSISDLRPSLVPVMIRERFAAELSGLTLKNVTLSVFEEGRKKPVYSELGEVSFAAYGIAGPLTLSASCVMDTDKLEGGKYTAVIDLKPALDREQLDRRLLRDFESAHGDSFEKELTRLLPVQMIPVFANLTGIDHATSCSRLTRQDRAKILELLKCFKLTPYALRPIEEAIITRGGVSVKEINPVTMESKLVKGLYFSGEIIDVDATTGGYNLQIAFSTANSAAAAIAGKTKKESAQQW